ncbi:MAG: hypothetical protein QOD61_1555 [Solirubrobacteraceae bacterium]|jgi:AcrR family transcriptional regulator|nr:hypothetical protein [Solirubrobacteraceae bacterium]
MPASSRRPYAARMPPLDRRRQLLDAALAVIIRDGYGAVSIETIAREAEVSRPVIYGVFAGLGELLEALLDRQEQRALAQLSRVLPAVPADEDPDRFLVGVARSLAEAVAGDPDTWRPILLPPEGTPAAVRERVDRDRERVRRQVEVLLEWSVARRGGPPGFDVELASHALVAVAEHGGRLVLSDSERFSPSRLAGLVEVLLGASAPLADGP